LPSIRDSGRIRVTEHRPLRLLPERYVDMPMRSGAGISAVDGEFPRHDPRYG
jgi:hypothetical protein